MKIAHFAPFVPSRCGLYEAARDCVVADRLAGHDARLVDVGILEGSIRLPSVVGERDERGGDIVETVSQESVYDADVAVAHDGIPERFLARTQMPVMWVLHGRPEACLRVQQKTGQEIYTLFPRLASWPRVKALVTHWNEHVPYWRHVLPSAKLRSVGAPPVDSARFCMDGPVAEIEPEKRGLFNVVIADSWREDVDVFDVLHAVLEAADAIDGLRVHVYSVEAPRGDWVWEPLFSALRARGICGQVVSRVADMAPVYRSMDALLTPHCFPTRVLAEALCCGLPVVAADGCAYTIYTGRISSPENMARALESCAVDVEMDRMGARAAAVASSCAFTLGAFAEKMTAIYMEITR